MYINEALRLAKRCCPSEYDDDEMYIWCDELSSMLLTEDREILREIYLTADKDGIILLPECVDIENVCDIFSSGGKRIEKSDYRAFGGGRTGVGCKNELMRIVYIQPYMPIRRERYRGAIEPTDGGFIADGGAFLPGDILTLSYLSADGGAESVTENILLMEVSHESDGRIKFTAALPDDAELAPSENCLIERVVTEKTACAAPFDGMYVDYILAKINLYQRDIEAYNQYMTSFNSRLSAYKRWLMGRMPQDEGKLRNWW